MLEGARTRKRVRKKPTAPFSFSRDFLTSCDFKFLWILSLALSLFFVSMDDFRTSRAMPRSPPPKGSFLKFGLPFLSAVVVGSFVLEYFTQTRYDQQQARNVRVSLFGYHFPFSDSLLFFFELTILTILWTTDNPRRRREGIGQEEATQHSGRILCKFLHVYWLYLVALPDNVHLSLTAAGVKGKGARELGAGAGTETRGIRRKQKSECCTNTKNSICTTATPVFTFVAI